MGSSKTTAYNASNENNDLTKIEWIAKFLISVAQAQLSSHFRPKPNSCDDKSSRLVDIVSVPKIIQWTGPGDQIHQPTYL